MLFNKVCTIKNLSRTFKLSLSKECSAWYCALYRYCWSSGKAGGPGMNGTHQLMVYTADVNILGRSVHAMKENTEALVVSRKEAGLEVNADKTKYMIMSHCQNAEHDHNIKIGNKSFERVEEFKYLEKL
jgi:hypothetical protein